MFEQRKHPLLSKAAFVQHQFRCIGATPAFVTASMAIGVACYMWHAGFPLLDAFLNAKMILDGMGPIGELPNDGAKCFASC